MKRKPLIVVGTRFTDEKGRVIMVSADYCDAVADAGAVPLLSASIPKMAYITHILEDASGLLLTGARDIDPSVYGEIVCHRSVKLMHPRRQEADFLLCRTALRRRMPILGICGGTQVVNVVLGGSLIQHIPDRYGHRGTLKCPKHHRITIKKGGLLSRILRRKELVVNSYHHQAVKRLGRGLVVGAYAEDGTVEAIEHSRGFVLGVQWHPERETEDVTKKALFRWLVAEAEKYVRKNYHC